MIATQRVHGKNWILFKIQLSKLHDSLVFWLFSPAPYSSSSSLNWFPNSGPIFEANFCFPLALCAFATSGIGIDLMVVSQCSLAQWTWPILKLAHTYSTGPEEYDDDGSFKRNLQSQFSWEHWHKQLKMVARANHLSYCAVHQPRKGGAPECNEN